MQAKERGRFEDNRERINRPGRMKTAHRPATRRSEGRRLGDPFSRPIEDQELVLDDHGFGHYRAGAAWTGESGNGVQQMQKQGGQIAHRRILPRSRYGQKNALEILNSPCTRWADRRFGSFLQRLGPDSNARPFAGVPELAVECRERDCCADRLLPCQGRRELDSVIAAQREVPREGLSA
jgi:hypothetical protein